MKDRFFSGKQLKSDIFLKIFSSVAFIYALFIAINYANQPLLEQFGFRQTQTALTSLWFIKDGFKFAYETPVAGAPWSIPLEFPIYQYLVAITSEALGSGLDATGRVISFVFLAGCLVPVRSICRQLSLPQGVFWIFTGLLFSSPIYLEWGRSFMMETAAVFFSVVAIKYFIEFLATRTKKCAALFVFFIAVSLLQKATTALPVLAVMALLFLFHEMDKNSGIVKSITVRNILTALVLFAVPIALGVAWTFYTDVIKLDNKFGTYITSSALSKWNWGTVSQRFSEDLYLDVMWKRMIVQNLGGLLGLAIVLGAFYASKRSEIRWVIGTALLLGILPFFIFTNLHLIHLYYQSANAIFLIFALAVALAVIVESKRSPALVSGVLLALMASNYVAFAEGYYGDITKTMNSADNQELGVASAIKNNVKPDEAFVAFGNDWNSSLSYYSERKSFTVPNWFKDYNDVVAHPQSYLGGMSVGAVVICAAAPRPSGRDLLNFTYNDKKFKLVDAAGCFLALPERAVDLSKNKSAASCEGSLDFVVGVEKIPQTLSVSGWTTVAGAESKLPDIVYITLTDAKGSISYYDAAAISRPDVNNFFRQADLGPAGFSRIIDVKPLSGQFTVGVARVVNDQLEQCQFQKSVEIGN